jgi:outer membrane protein assembly factor BamE (lipoprotein component of BamABCDE complex)
MEKSGTPFSGRLRRNLCLLVLAGSGCAHDDQSKVKELDAQLFSRVGKASREDITAFLGEPEVKDRIGDVEVWIYQFTSVSKGGITAFLKAAATHYDELIMTFDGNGVLQKYTAVIRGQKGSKGRK